MNIDVLPKRIELGNHTAYIERTPLQVVYRIYRNGCDTPVATGGGYKRDLVGKQATRKLQELEREATA